MDETRTTPKTGYGYGIKILSKRNHGIAVIKHHSRCETFLCCSLELLQTIKVGRRNCRARLDLNPCQFTSGLQNNIYFILILISEMTERNIIFLPAGLSAQFLKDKSFQELSKQGAILP